MGLFGKQKRELPPLITDEELDEAIVNHDSVLEYLVDLSKADYEKMLKVANIYRNADKDARKVLGIKGDATNEITKETRLEAKLDDDLPFLLDDEPAEKPKTIKKVKIKKDQK